jgi:hypothetical protein
MKRLRKTMAFISAGASGRIHADEWLNRLEKPLPPLLMECAAWRAHCYAETVKRYEVRPEFLILLAEWERGFDENVREAEQFYAAAAVGASAPAPVDVEGLIAQANALVALLAVADALPAASRQSVLVSCSTIANEAARDLEVILSSMGSGKAVSA